MEIIVALVCGLILGASGTFTLGVIIYVVMKVAGEQEKFSLFNELAQQFENAPTAEIKPKQNKTKKRHGRPKK